jgi:flagellar biosynthesis chaperone FliJ
MLLSLKITRDKIEELRTKLNKIYDEIERMDAQIDMMILKRNNLKNQVEAGIAMIIKYERQIQE